MAGQGIERRDVLRILDTAMAVAQFSGFSKWAFGCGHIGNAHRQIKPAVYHPQFFTTSEYAVAERLSDLIIPSDGTPGAKDAGGCGIASAIRTKSKTTHLELVVQGTRALA